MRERKHSPALITHICKRCRNFYQGSARSRLCDQCRHLHLRDNRYARRKADPTPEQIAERAAAVRITWGHQSKRADAIGDE